MWARQEIHQAHAMYARRPRARFSFSVIVRATVLTALLGAVFMRTALAAEDSSADTSTQNSCTSSIASVESAAIAASGTSVAASAAQPASAAGVAKATADALPPKESTNGPGQNSQSGGLKPSEPPHFLIQCEYVVPQGVVAVARRTWFGNSTSKPSENPTAFPKNADESALVLTGPGDVVVVVSDEDYGKAVKLAGSKPLRVFLNGFDMGPDSQLRSVVRQDGKAALRFHVAMGKTSQTFWTTLYNDVGIVSKEPLTVSVGWASEPAFTVGDVPADRQLYVKVTNWLALASASILGGLLVWFFVWALRNSDTFRVAPLYPMWLDARALQTQIHKAVLPFSRNPFQSRLKKFIISKENRDKIAEAIEAKYDSFVWPDTLKIYDAARARALEGGKLPSDADIRDAVIGLALATKRWRPLRLPYSLARVQWGAWMMFATTAAVYLWLVYSTFPVLNGSVLGLVAVSTVTAGASLIVEINKGASTAYSKNFIYDLMTGPDGVQQAHRYQAIVINLLLFIVGTMYVIQELAYPVFDTTWLQLLGLSGIAQAAGKQILEKPSPDQTVGVDRDASKTGNADAAVTIGQTRASDAGASGVPATPGPPSMGLTPSTQASGDLGASEKVAASQIPPPRSPAN